MNLLTRDIRAKAIPALRDLRELEEIMFELQFRRRKQARELRAFLVDFIDTHPDNYAFKWPGTDATKGDGVLDADVFEHQQGVLRALGYRVGREGAGALARRELLQYAFLRKLPSVNSSDYMRQWGSPNSAKRLQKMANSIAAFARAAKRRGKKVTTEAVRDWESDLTYLKRTFYDGVYDFPWPKTAA